MRVEGLADVIGIVILVVKLPKLNIECDGSVVHGLRYGHLKIKLFFTTKISLVPSQNLSVEWRNKLLQQLNVAVV